MQQLLTGRARAYVYCGEWVAECPRPCGNVEFLFDLEDPARLSGPRTRRKPQFYCSYCRTVAVIDWPPDDTMQAITGVLRLRPVPHTRNWYPREHLTAMRHGVEHGQSIDDLREENLAHGVPAQEVA